MKRSQMPYYPQPIAEGHEIDSRVECMYSAGSVGGDKNRGITIREKIFIEQCSKDSPQGIITSIQERTDFICSEIDRMYTEKR